MEHCLTKSEQLALKLMGFTKNEDRTVHVLLPFIDIYSAPKIRLEVIKDTKRYRILLRSPTLAPESMQNTHNWKPNRSIKHISLFMKKWG